MTAKPVRELSYVAWKDPDAWMEKMAGAEWNKMLAAEKRHMDALLKPMKGLVGEMEREMRAVEPVKHAELFTLADGAICIQSHPGGKFTWRWSWSDKKHWAYDIDVVGKTVWYVTTDDDSSHYKNALICEEADDTTTGCRIIWKKKAVAQQVAIRDGLCYYIKVEDYFTTVELCCCNAYTGANERILYREKDKRRDLGIVATVGKTLYLYSEDAGNKRTWRITHDNLVPLDTDTEDQMVLGRWPDRQHGEDQRIVRKKGSYKIELRGNYIRKWDLPTGFPEHVNLMTGTVIVRDNEEQALWFCGSDQRPKPILRLPLAHIKPNGWRIWEGSIVEEFTIHSPAEPVYLIRVLHGKIIETVRPFAGVPAGPYQVKRYTAASADGTRVPFAVVGTPDTLARPGGLLVYGYGAYGTPTNVGWPGVGWAPLLRRGWVIVYAFVRGGGDRGDKWTDNARLTKRHHSIEDFEAVVARAQAVTGLGPEKTVIYGRSAGGVLVGALAARHPHGDLMGAIYTEVPYVDLLRTQTNPELPLTVGEYHEFGNPAKHVADFAAMLAISPVDRLTCEGAPGVFVLARTGLKDHQVYPYEPFKWIRRLRGADAVGPAGKFIAFERDQAHTYEGPVAGAARAADLAVLEAWLRGQKNRTHEYKRTKMAKNNKNNKTQGGKRMKMRKSAKKSMKRRATRKNNKKNNKN